MSASARARSARGGRDVGVGKSQVGKCETGIGPQEFGLRLAQGTRRDLGIALRLFLAVFAVRGRVAKCRDPFKRAERLVKCRIGTGDLRPGTVTVGEPQRALVDQPVRRQPGKHASLLDPVPGAHENLLDALGNPGRDHARLGRHHAPDHRHGLRQGLGADTVEPDRRRRRGPALG